MSMTTPYRVVATGAIVWPGAIVAGCQTHENMSADAWAGLGCEPYVAPPVQPVPEPTAEAKLAAEASRILSDPDHGADATEAVQGVAAAVARVAALGIDIADWSFQGVTAAAQLASGKVDDIKAKFEILQAALALRVAWDRWEYHCGSMYAANHLWPYAYGSVFQA